MLIKILLYATTLRVIYLIINLLETLNYPRIVLIIKTQHLVAGRRNNCSFLTLYRNRYLIRLLKHLITSILSPEPFTTHITLLKGSAALPNLYIPILLLKTTNFPTLKTQFLLPTKLEVDSFAFLPPFV